MRIFNHYSLSLLAFLFLTLSTFSQNYSYNDSWFEDGMKLADAKQQSVEISFSISDFALQNVEINREELQNIIIKGNILPNDEGLPNLPRFSKYVAIPEGSVVKIKILESRTELLKNIEIAPAPQIPLDTDIEPLKFEKDREIYSTNTFYPAEPVIVSDIMEIRGVDVVLLGITPFQYNPVTKELKVIRDVKVELEFEGGENHFGEDRLRSRWFESILQDAVINYTSLPKVDFNARLQNQSRDVAECEYLIISPNDDVFQQWADSIKQFRIKQGISTEIITIDEVGGNNANVLENFIDDIYSSWEYPPAAILMLGDYGFDGDNSLISPIWNGYCVSDNMLGDVNGDDLPDIVMARITAQDEEQLEVMITKFLNHERNPPTNPDFYNEPITALGWQTERWFQICSETVGGFFKNVLGKDPVRINEVYGGNPNNDPWSTYENTPTIMAYFGPDGLGYIPATPGELGNWSGGNASMINNAINSGSFILQHRDHGGESGWGEPSYNNTSINGLNNSDLTFIMSINCLTGKYNISGQCFAEKFHRYTSDGHNSGALGLIAASEVSYSFVNDTYVWGFYDNLWPDFMPDYGTNPESRGLLPAFGNAAGKYFLQQSSWPMGNSVKPVTYHLFHMHGDAFLTLYSEVPQELTVAHNPVLIGGETSFMVAVDEGAFIALTINGEILATAESEGGGTMMTIPPQTPGNTMYVTITKTNYYRYEMEVPVITPEGPYCLYKADSTYDENNNGQLEYAENAFYSLGIKNYGNDNAANVDVFLRTNDEFVTIIDTMENYGLINADDMKWVYKGFEIEIADNIPDQHNVLFTVVSKNQDDTWTNSFVSTFHAPILEVDGFEIEQEEGEINGRLDPGETAYFKISVSNLGSAEAYNGMGELNCNCDFVTIDEDVLDYGNIGPEQQAEQSFMITAAEDTPGGTIATFIFTLEADYGITTSDTFNIIIGQYPALVIDMSTNQQSGEALFTAVENYDLNVVLANEFPEEDLIFYKSVFLCLGTYYSNYELSEAESDRLIDYLERGGNIYIEGGVTWSNDPQQDIHDMFGVSIDEGSWFTYEEVYGVNECFTGDMYFEYDAYTPNNNFTFIPENDAFVIFNRELDEYNCAVANEEEDYKTIASAVEFGAFVDGEMPSTQAYLMKEYLKFFGILDPYVGITDPDFVSNSISAYPNPFNNRITFEINIAKESMLTFEILDLQGRKIITLVDENKKAGQYKINWNANDEAGNHVSPGIYIYKLSSDNNCSSGKIFLINE